MKHFAAALALSAALSVPALAQEAEHKVIGVSIPAATHGWAGGMNYFAQAAVERLAKTYPQLEFVLTTASDPSKQVNDIEDMVATRHIDALVVLPFESEPLTGPVQNAKASGAWITVVDRGLAVPGIEDLYVAGDNPGFGRKSGEFMVEALPEGAKIVVLRGLPTTFDNERVEGFQAAIDGKGFEILGMEHGNWNRDR